MITTQQAIKWRCIARRSKGNQAIYPFTLRKFGEIKMGESLEKKVAELELRVKALEERTSAEATASTLEKMNAMFEEWNDARLRRMHG